MHPVPHTRAYPGRRLRLRDFAAVMRKNQICSSAMDIDLRPQETRRHGRTFDVPAWPSRPPGAWPGWFTGSSAPPEEKIQWIALSWITWIVPVQVRAFQELVVAHQPAGIRQLRKLRITAYLEINPSIIDIGIAALQKPLNEREHGRQLLRRTDKVVGHDDVNGVHFAHKSLRLLLRKLIPRDVSQLKRLFKQGIINIGDIFYIHHAQPLRTQIADKDVKCREDEGMPKMASIIGRYPAHVEFYFVITRNEGLDLLAEAVEELH